MPFSQSAFIKTRSIHDNFLYVKNAVRSLHKSKSAALLLKLDIAGAFDSVSWGYMFELLSAMGFGPRWCDLLAVLWRSSSSRIMVNGELGLPFSHKQGLRQGDPISPMLFTIAIAPLHWLFAKASSVGALSPLRLPASRLRVSLYADDAALFVAPTLDDIHCTREILHLFGSASGLKANVHKSMFLPIACDDIDLNSLLQYFPVPLRTSLASTSVYHYTSKRSPVLTSSLPLTRWLQGCRFGGASLCPQMLV